MGILLVYDVTDEKSFTSASLPPPPLPLVPPLFPVFLSPEADSSAYGVCVCVADIRTWHQNIEQHASENVNKILIGNKCDSDSARQVSVEQGRELADELGLRFLETSAKANEGVEEAFFTLARYVVPPLFPPFCSSTPPLVLRS